MEGAKLLVQIAYQKRQMKESPLAIVMNTPILQVSTFKCKVVKNGTVPNCTVLYMATGCPKIPTSINKVQMCSQLVPVYYAVHLRTLTLCSKSCQKVQALIGS